MLTAGWGSSKTRFGFARPDARLVFVAAAFRPPPFRRARSMAH
jgi:hypothetical protein